MRIGKARKAIQKLAIREGVSEREICREIEETMLEAMQQARERSDWETLERWAKETLNKSSAAEQRIFRPICAV